MGVFSPKTGLLFDQRDQFARVFFAWKQFGME